MSAVKVTRKNVKSRQSLKGKISSAITVMMLVKPILAPGANAKIGGKLCSIMPKIMPSAHRMPKNIVCCKVCFDFIMDLPTCDQSLFCLRGGHFA